MHGLMIDSARAMERPAYYQQLFHFLAERGVDTVIWHFTDDQGCSLVFDSMPLAASPHALNKSQMRQLLDLARSLGIEIIPELETFGHTRYITNLPQYRHLLEGNDNFSGICPVLPLTREVISKLIQEIAQLFDSPWIHVGMDEVAIGDHPATREALADKTSGQIYAEYAQFIYEQVCLQGKKMMMWGDHIVDDASIADHLPRDILIAAWHYTAKVDPEVIRPHLKRGFNVLLCGAMISYDQMLFPGEMVSLSNLRCMSEIERMSHPGPGRIVGQVTTVWTPTRYMHDALWIGLDLATAYLKQGSQVDHRQQAFEFARSFYGITPTSQWLDAIDILYRLSPQHSRWIELLRGHDADGNPVSISDTEVLGWCEAYESVDLMKGQIRKNHIAYETFSLLFDLVSSMCQRVRDCNAGQWGHAILTTRRLIDEVEAVWDRERYSDDTRKNCAAWARDRVNHLIEQMYVGLDYIQTAQYKE